MDNMNQSQKHEQKKSAICASSLRSLSASRVSATLPESFFSCIGWNCSLCAFWFLNGKSLRFPEFCISVSVFDRLWEQVQCCVQIAFFQPFLSLKWERLSLGAWRISVVLQGGTPSPCVFCIHSFFSNGIKIFLIDSTILQNVLSILYPWLKRIHGWKCAWKAKVCMFVC